VTIGREKSKELQSICNWGYLGEAGKNRLLCWGLLTSVLLLLSSVPLLASFVMGNAGMLALRDGLVAQGDFIPGDYPFYAALAAGESTEQIAQTLRHAVALNPGSLSLRWALGRRCGRGGLRG